MLEKIKSSEDVKKLSKQEKIELAEEIRKYILEVVSENGGHLASNLGVVELTIALHSVFDMSKDKIIWDVGHQSYIHKILTGGLYHDRKVQDQRRSHREWRQVPLWQPRPYAPFHRARRRRLRL